MVGGVDLLTPTAVQRQSAATEPGPAAMTYHCLHPMMMMMTTTTTRPIVTMKIMTACITLVSMEAGGHERTVLQVIRRLALAFTVVAWTVMQEEVMVAVKCIKQPSVQVLQQLSRRKGRTQQGQLGRCISLEAATRQDIPSLDLARDHDPTREQNPKADQCHHHHRPNESWTA